MSDNEIIRDSPYDEIFGRGFAEGFEAGRIDAADVALSMFKCEEHTDADGPMDDRCEHCWATRFLREALDAEEIPYEEE